MDNIKKLGEQIILEMIQEIERKSMPQVKGKDVDEVLKIFDESGIGYEQGNAKCSDLSATQEDYIPEKLESLTKKIQETDWVTHPLFVSKEGKILDGHHRWLAYREVYGDDHEIPVTKVDLPLEQALKTFDDSAERLGEGRYNATYLPMNKKVVVKETLSEIQRYCPGCNKILTYVNKRKRNLAESSNRACRSCAKKGKNNPMYGKTENKSPLFGKKRPDIVERNKSEWMRKKVSESQKGERNSMYGKAGHIISHTKEAKKKISENNKSGTNEIREKIRKGVIEKQYGFDYNEWLKNNGEKKKYYSDVWFYTNKQPLNLLENCDKRGRAGIDGMYHLDHKISIIDGFMNNISPKKIGNIDNLRFITWKDNQKKGGKSLIVENKNQKIIAVLPGRFQPYHAGHDYSRDAMKKKFGDVYVSTSNKVEPGKSPFNFLEKKQIMKKMFGISTNKILSITRPYNADSYEKIGDPNKDVLVIGLGEKDAKRLGGKWYKPYKGNENNLKPFNEHIYTYIVPQLQMKVGGKTISGTVIREVFKKGSDKAKQQLFKKLYGKFDKGIYELITSKLNESVVLNSDVIEYYVTEVNIKQLLLEVSQADESQVDDGPATFYKHPNNYHKDVDEIIGKLGWQVIDYLAGNKDEFAGQRYKYDHVSDVSFGDVGVRDTIYPDPIAKYKSHMEHIAARLGYSIVDWLMTGDKKEDMIDDPKSTMATEEPLVQDTSDAAPPLKEEKLFSKEWWTENVMTDKQPLLEGGAYGHLAHPFDDKDLTFGDLKTIIDTALEGKLDMTQEKTDGQNLMMSWKDGRLVAARNKSHLKNFGENALDTAGVSNMFAGRGEIQDAFTFAMKDLEKAIKGLSQKQKDSIFENGKKFMSFEVMYPATTNVIPYGLSMLLFHGTMEYDKDGNVIGGSKEDAKVLADMIKDTNQEIQDNYTIGDVPVLQLPKAKDFSEQKSKFNNKLNTLKKKFKLKDSDKVILYHQFWWEEFITKQAKKNKYGIPNRVMMNLVKRWAYTDKSYKISDMKKEIDNEKFLKWALDFDKKDHAKQLKKNIEPFEFLFLEIGAQILKNMNNLLTANPEKAVQQMKKELNKVIKELEAANDIKKMEKLKVQLNRLKAIGGMDAIVPTEGITFQYKGKLYKFTGTFAPINQILGVIKFG